MRKSDHCLAILFLLRACEQTGSCDFAFVGALEIRSLRLRLQLQMLYGQLNGIPHASTTTQVSVAGSFPIARNLNAAIEIKSWGFAIVMGCDWMIINDK